MKRCLILFLGIFSATIVQVNSFCSRPYDYEDWEAQTIEKRSQDADIIVYAEVIKSPCHKPEPLTTTTQTPVTTAATILEKIGLGNSTSNESLSSNYTTTLMQETTTSAPTTTTAPTTTAIPTTAVPLPAHNCSFGSYNASLRIHCVIKGGAIPEYINLEQLGLGNGTCVFRELNETEHDFHAYNGRNYTIFLKRRHNAAKEDSFTLHTVNVQPATKEMVNTTMLKPIFKVAGRHAHAAIDVWVNKTDPICKPYSGATSPMLFSLASMTFITVFTFFLY